MHRGHASLGFMLAGGIPGSCAILYDYTRYERLVTPVSSLIFWYVIIPAVLAGISGFVFGAAIFDPEKVKTAAGAAARGLLVSLVAWLAYAPILSSWMGKAFYMNFFQKLLLILIGGTVVIGWLIAVVGMATGVLLFNLGKPSANSPAAT